MNVQNKTKIISDKNLDIVTCAGLFSGIGGFCSGFEKLGYKTSWVNELSTYSTAVYSKNFPTNRVVQKDIKDVSVENDKLSPVDVLHAGFPCQSFSGAGARTGFEDERGQLFFEIIRLVKEFGQDKPNVLLLENTPNLLTGGGGSWLNRILTEIQDCGYWVGRENCVLIDTQENFGIPQRRSRVFIFAVNKDFYDGNPFCETVMDLPFYELEDISSYLDLETKKSEYYYLSKQNRFGIMLWEHLKNLPPYSLAQLRKSYVREVKYGLCPTLTANMGLGGHNVPFVKDSFGLRKLTERECFKLQGFADDFIIEQIKTISSPKLYEMIGNSVSPRVSGFLADLIKNFVQGNK